MNYSRFIHYQVNLLGCPVIKNNGIWSNDLGLFLALGFRVYATAD